MTKKIVLSGVWNGRKTLPKYVNGWTEGLEDRWKEIANSEDNRDVLSRWVAELEWRLEQMTNHRDKWRKIGHWYIEAKCLDRDEAPKDLLEWESIHKHFPEGDLSKEAISEQEYYSP